MRVTFSFIILQALEVIDIQNITGFNFNNCKFRSATSHLLMEVFTIIL